jgi:hypothetical protein
MYVRIYIQIYINICINISININIYINIYIYILRAKDHIHKGPKRNYNDDDVHLNKLQRGCHKIYIFSIHFHIEGIKV